MRQDNGCADVAGYTQASCMYGGIGLALTVIPFVLFFKGPQIRARSRVVQQLRAAAAIEAEKRGDEKATDV